MKTKLAIILCLFILTINIGCKQTSKEKQIDKVNKIRKTSLTTNFDTSGKMLFNYLERNTFTSSLEFGNPTTSDTAITRTLLASKPTHLFRLEAKFLGPAKPIVVTHHTLLIMPGDSIVIDQNKEHVVYSRYDVDYIDSLIDSKKFYAGELPEMKRKLNAHGLQYLVDEIERQYQFVKMNLARRLKNNNEEYIEALHTLNYVWKMNRIASIPIYGKHLSTSEEAVLDSVYDEIVKNIDRISSIKSSFSYPIISSLVSYNAYKRGRLTGNFWDYFNLADPAVIESELYRSFLLNKMNADYNQNKRIDELTQIVERVKDAGIKDSRHDSLLQTKTALKMAVSKPVYAMHKTSGEEFEYTSLLDSLKGSYVFVDFWASWCGPCRRQMPYLRELKPELRDKNVKFVAISIDNDDQLNDWIAASKDEGLDKEAFNFRLLRGNQNKLLQVLEIEAVPRYFLYDPQGRLVSGNFMTPNKKEFRQHLLDEITN